MNVKELRNLLVKERELATINKLKLVFPACIHVNFNLDGCYPVEDDSYYLVYETMRGRARFEVHIDEHRPQVDVLYWENYSDEDPDDMAQFTCLEEFEDVTREMIMKVDHKSA